ncbi:MAG: peptidylprolyl isomerase, partial [Anaerolineae bacterium]
MAIDTSKTYQAIIRMKNGGEMVFNLFDDESPVTVNNFVYLANQGYYDGTTF